MFQAKDDSPEFIERHLFCLWVVPWGYALLINYHLLQEEVTENISVSL